MSTFRVHTPETAPEASQPLLKQARRSFGFVANVVGVIAESPVALEAYLSLSKTLKKSAFSAVERQVIFLTSSFENGCEYCRAAHSTAARVVGAPEELIRGVLGPDPLDDARLEALRVFTRELIRRRGWVPPEGVQAFLDAGYDKAHVLDLITAISMKTITNYVNHIADTPIDAQFQTAPAAAL